MAEQDKQPDSAPFRAQLLLRREHYFAMTWIWIICVLGMVFYFGVQAYLNDGLADIDDQPPTKFRYSVDLNDAPWPEFANLPGIGEVLAKSIVQFRETNGPFEQMEQLMDIPKIGEAKFRLVQPFLVLDTPRSPVGADDNANLE